MSTIEPKKMKRISQLCAVALSLSLLAHFCNSHTESTAVSTPKQVLPSFEVAAFEQPNGLETLHAGEPLQVLVHLPPHETLDSVVLKWDGMRLATVKDSVLALETQALPLGHHSLILESWKGGKMGVPEYTPVLLRAGMPPVAYGYRVIKEYPHDEASYTQGLLIRHGKMYESAGQRGMSSLRKVELQTGEVLQLLSMDPSYFAEGLAMYGGKLYQLTWTSGKCFEYDKSTFNRMNTLFYNTQGWGLEADQQYFYMTDGSERVYVRDPKSFNTVRTLQVYDNEGRVNMLNELELIDGLLYANVYMTDEIVAIDLATGAVVKRIDLSGLLPDRLRTRTTDVLNGIAYDHDSGKIYVTGKNWPRLYQVEFVRK